MDAFSPCRIQTPQSAVHAACNEKDANSPMKVPALDDLRDLRGFWWLMDFMVDECLMNVDEIEAYTEL